jgi:hypothetical protein
VDAERFDSVARSLAITAPRRVALVALTGSVLTILKSGVGWQTTDAKRRKGKGKRKKIQRNSFGCVDVGKACAGKDANCCSGICDGRKPKKGKQDKSRCVAHNTGSCQPENDGCEDPAHTSCGTSGVCFRTTGKASFCASIGVCEACASDADCEAMAGPGSACIVCARNSCGTGQTTVCFAPAP